MEKFHLIIHLLTPLLILAPYLSHGEEAGANNSEPNFEKENTSSKLKIKILKVKRRETDYCERVITNYSTKKPTICSTLGDINSACERAQCIIMPGPPSMLEYALQPNKTTKKVDLHIAWKEPKFGSERLCGFQVQVASLNNFILSYCMQLNSKSLFSYSFPGLNFNTKYNITILSLPPSKDAEKSSSSILAQSPDECTVFKHWDESPPWFCKIENNFPVACKNGSFNVTFEKLQKVDANIYHSMLIRTGSRGPPIRQSLHTKDHTFVAYSNLTLDAEYLLLTTVAKGGKFYTLKSKPFTCKELSATTTPRHSRKKGIGLLWKILIPTTSFIVLGLLLFVCKRYRLIARCREGPIPSHEKAALGDEEDIDMADDLQVNA